MSNESRREKRWLDKSNRKAKKQLEMLATEYFQFIDKLPKENKENHQKIKNKLNSLNERWESFCRKTKKDKSGYKPMPDFFAIYITNINKKRSESTKKIIEVIEIPKWQRFVSILWKIFYKERYKILQEELKSGFIWKDAYQTALEKTK